MAPVLGKRKRRDNSTGIDVNQGSTANDDYAKSQALFRQHFESTFEPLPGSLACPPLVHNIDTKPSDEELESEWDGFSDHGEECAETVHRATIGPSNADISKDEYKTFMVKARIIIVHQYQADYVS